MNIIDLPLEIQIVSAVLLISFVIQLYHLLFRVRNLAFYKQGEVDNSFTPPVSVIICAKNESINLTNFLPSILNQDYPNFEVIVVNDGSEDDTELVLSKFKQEHPHLYYTSIPIDKKFTHGKKLAVSIGIKAANNEHLVFTDADCYAATDQWLKGMVSGFAKENKEIVLGFGAYKKEKGFTNFLIRYDTFYIAIQYLSYALKRRPYMGVGRNLAYKKSLFTQNRGMSSHMHIASGDDDLFISETATKNNTSIVVNPSAHTFSLGPQNLSRWKDQKSRHLTTAHYHKRRIKFSLFIEPFSRLFLIISAIFLILINKFVIIVGSLVFLKYLIQLILWRKISKLLNQGKLYWSLLFFDLLHPLFLLWAYLSSVRRNKNRWK